MSPAGLRRGPADKADLAAAFEHHVGIGDIRAAVHPGALSQIALRQQPPFHLPGIDPSQPKEAFGPARQRLDQLSSGVTKPNGKLVALIVYFACTVPEV